MTVHLLLLLILMLTSNLLIAPGASRWLLLLLLLAGVGRLERNSRASFVHNLLKRVSGPPTADRVSLDLLALLVDVGKRVQS